MVTVLSALNRVKSACGSPLISERDKKLSRSIFVRRFPQMGDRRLVLDPSIGGCDWSWDYR